MALNYVTLTGTFDDGQGNPLTGTATFTPSATVYAAGVPVLTAGVPVQAIINSSGLLKNSSGGPLQLLATDNAITIEGLTGFWFWTVSYVAGGSGGPGFSFFLPHSPSTVDLFALASTGGAAGFSNPMTTLGDLIYENATPAAARLAGSTSATKNFLTQTGTGSVSAAPAWGTIAPADLAATAAATGRTLYLGTSGSAQWGQAGLFDITAAAYGAKGDGKVVHDGAITGGTAALACATSTPFTAGDVGKLIMVKGAGAANPFTLVTTIASFTDSGHVTLTASATTTVTAAMVMWATDDTAAIQAAINAAFTYGQAHGGATVLTPPAAGLFYGVGGALVTGGTTKGNAQLTLPIQLDASIGPKVNLTFLGAGSGAGTEHWKQTSPVLGPSTWVSFGVFATAAAQSTAIGANGNPCCLGGPAQPNGYGTSALLYSNMYVTMRDMSILTTYSAQGIGYSAFDFSGIACAALQDFAWGTTGVFVDNDFQTPSAFSGGLVYGGLMPANGNNDICDCRNITVHGGFTYGLGATEHTDIHGARILRNWSGLTLLAAYNSSVGAFHPFRWSMLSSEGNTRDIHVIGSGAAGNLYIDGHIDNEGGIVIGQDGSNGWTTASGILRLAATGSVTSPATNVAITNDQQAIGHMASPPAVPASTSTATLVYRNAWVSIHTGAGVTVSAVTIDGTATGLTMAASSSLGVSVPTGKTIALTYAGGTPTWDWWLS